MTRRREMNVSELRVTTHALQVLKVMRDQKVSIYFDNEVCVLLTTPNRKISHKCVVSLRAQRFIRPRDDDRPHYVLTHRALTLLDTDARTRPKEEWDGSADSTVPHLWFNEPKSTDRKEYEYDTGTVE